MPTRLARRHRRLSRTLIQGDRLDGGSGQMQIAIAGLGRMGAGMARRLARTGHEVIAWNRTAAGGHRRGRGAGERRPRHRRGADRDHRRSSWRPRATS